MTAATRTRSLLVNVANLRQSSVFQIERFAQIKCYVHQTPKTLNLHHIISLNRVIRAASFTQTTPQDVYCIIDLTCKSLMLNASPRLVSRVHTQLMIYQKLVWHAVPGKSPQLKGSSNLGLPHVRRARGELEFGGSQNSLASVAKGTSEKKEGQTNP